jgi:hypothetical protein
MNKIDLEVKIESLKNMITEEQQQTSNYAGQLDKLNTELADVNKVALLPSQFDDIYEAIESGINEFDFTDTENFEIEYGIDYDNRINCESHEFRNHEDLLQMINDKIQVLFKEIECPEEDVTKAS